MGWGRQAVKPSRPSVRTTRASSRATAAWSGAKIRPTLEAATSNAAELLRVAEVGMVEEGRAADLVLFDGDPLDDVELVLKPSLVMRAGERVA